MNDVVILSGVRTAIGDFGGGLKDQAPSTLASLCIAAAIERAGIAPAEVGHVVLGNVIHTEARDMYLSRVAAIGAGIPVETPALTLNRLCGSGLQAIISAAQAIMLGDTKIAVAGGAESMSRAPYAMPGARWGTRMGEAAVVDMLTGALTDPFGNGHMGITAENVAKRYGVSRDDQDRFAVESHRRAAMAVAEGRFGDQILPIVQEGRKGVIRFEADEHVRAQVSVEDLSKLRPVFQKDGSVTAGNASPINDGAAALVLMDAGEAARRGAKPLARIVAYAHSGVAPDEMGMGPVPAVRQVLKRAGLSVADLDVIESNEAFAAQACAVSRQLDLPPDRVNPNGGAVALGHPIGATGAIITIKALYELARIGGRRALMTMCIGGGQGIAMIIERA
jgi:acetyl-CoA C-acetyltransferase